MSAITMNPRSEEGIPLGRLVKIETRKALDTRSGFWLGMVIIGLTVLILVLNAAGALEDATSAQMMNTAFAPAGGLLPFVAILLVTSEFSARTALTTFVLVPNRWRVITAKLLAIVLIALGLLAAVAVVSAVASSISPAHLATRPGGVTVFDALWRTAVSTCVAVISGFGFGLVLRNTPAAIVGYMLLPTFVSAALILIPGLDGAEPWVGTGAIQKLTENSGLDSTDWAQIATASTIWLVLPLVLGLWRLARAEIK